MGAFQETQNRYLRYGITTVQDGMAVDGMVPLYQQLCRQKKLKLDLVAYGDMDNCQRLLEAFPSASYQSRFRIGGYKMFLDGFSPRPYRLDAGTLPRGRLTENGATPFLPTPRWRKS